MYCDRLHARFLMQSRLTTLLTSLSARHPFRVVLGQVYRGLTGGFLLLPFLSVAISVSPHVCFSLDLSVGRKNLRN